MKIDYELQENDFLQFQLFTASKSDRIKRKKRNSWLIMTFCSFIIAGYFYIIENHSLAIYFGLISILTALFYPNYFKSRYKNHYKKFIKENYAKRFGQRETLEFHSDYIFAKNKTGEGKIYLKEIEEINETEFHYFLKVSTGVSLFMPKQNVEQSNELISRFNELGIKVNDELSWKW
jgi:hypothetical protein